MMLLLLALLDWFSVYQYAPKTVALRGCSECKGEPDDLCEVRSGAQVRRVDEVRGMMEGRVYLLRSRADPDCAVPAKALLHSPLELAAMRIARAAPSQALLDRARPAVKGWPRAPQKRKAEPAYTAARPQRSTLRLALVCWASEEGWPRAGLDANNPCEWWLLPLRDGEPDLSAASFPLDAKPFSFGDSRWSRAFDPGASLDDSILLGETSAPAPELAAPAAIAHCGDAARARTAVLDRFEQWEAQIRGSRRSIDPASWTLNAAAWSGHCQEMDVLRGALEQQLGCALSQQGQCARSP
jgi:hypothetical protein